MANALLAWDNAIYDGLQAYVDGWWTYTNTVYNLAVPALSQRWITPGLAAVDTRCTLSFSDPAASGGLPTVAAIVLCSHNLSLGASVRIRASNGGSFSSLVYDSGTFAAYPSGVTEASRAGLRCNTVHVLSTPAAATYWRVEITEPSNPAGYVSVGRLLVAKAVWRPSINMLTGASIAFESNSESLKAQDASEWFTDQPAHRVARFALQVPEAEMLASGFDLARVGAGARRDVYFAWDPSDTVHAVRRSLVGRLRQLSAIEAPYYAMAKTAYEVKELL